MTGARRVTVIAHELRGSHPRGDTGTATACLALALARLGHSVEILLRQQGPGVIDREWDDIYRGAGIRIRPVAEPGDPVQPGYFAQTHGVMLGLQADPPDVVIAQDFGAPAYSALRLRQAGVAFAETLFVICCHATRSHVADLSPSVSSGDLETELGLAVLEQAAVELADVVVSPKAELVEGLNERGWQLPERTLVVPYSSAHEADASSARWSEIVDMQPRRGGSATRSADEHVEVVVVRRESQTALLRCVAALEEQTHPNVDVIVADTRLAGLDQGSAPYVVFLDVADDPDPRLIATLLAACRTTGADVATCGLRLADKLHFFAGEPRGLGAISNVYGNVALFDRHVLDDLGDTARGVVDPDWPLLARLAANRAAIVSIPLPLVQRRAAPGTAQNDPAGALEVAKQLERLLPNALRGMARVAAGLAAAKAI
jgi:hypothetical protein